jgi:hypothetical protein
MFDNSEIAGMRLIAARKRLAEPTILDQAAWHHLQELAK